MYYGGDGRRKFAVPAIEPGKSVEVELSKPLEEAKLEKQIRIAGDASQSGQLRLAVSIARQDDDFQIDRRTTLKERFDYYVLFR